MHNESLSQDKVKEIEFFNKFVEDQDYDVLTEHAYRQIITRFCGLIGDRKEKGRRVIDLGCGTGAFTRRFKQFIEADVVGVDISPRAVELAKTKNDGIEYLIGDITNLQLPHETFDVAILSGVLHHFHDFEPCLRECFRILKKGGCVVSYDPNRDNPIMWLYRHPSSVFCSRKGKTDNEILLSPADVRETLRKVGYQNVSGKGISGITFKYVESKKAKVFLPAYNGFEYILGNIPFLSETIGSFFICYGERP